MDINPIVVQVMEDFKGARPVLGISRATKISRITLNAWSYGQTPDLGVLLKHYFVGTLAAKELAYRLIFPLWPEVAKRLPIAE